MVRLVTGGTGFIGRHLLRELAKRDGDTYVLVREPSRGRLERLIASLGAADRMRALAGDITAPGLGLPVADHARLQGGEIYHLAAVYDLEASAEANERANVGGTRNVVALAEQLGARLHHVSSIAVAGGKWKGKFTEDMFEAGQALDHPYYKTKYEAESLVRASGVPFRIYRPGLVIGSSETGAADRIDGPYYAFKLIQRLRSAIPPWVPLVGLEGGEINIVPVDFVARALAEIGSKPDLDGQTFHLTDPAARSLGEVTNEFCRAAHAPQFTLRLDSRAASMLPREMTGMLQHWHVAQTLKRRLLEGVRIPEPALQYVTNRAKFTCDKAQAALAGSGVECPPLHTYAWKIWDYWERHLDPEAPTERNLRAVLQRPRRGGDRGIQRHRPRHRAAGRAARGEGGARLAYQGKAGRVERGDRSRRRTCIRVPDRSLRPRAVRRDDQARSRRPGRGGHPGQQRRSFDPALDRGFIRPVSRLPAHDAAELLRCGEADAGGAAWDAAAAPRTHHQHLEHRHAGLPAAIWRLRRLQVGAGRPQPVHRARGRGRRSRDHQHPHAARAHPDDRAHRHVQELPHQLAGGGRRDGGGGDPHASAGGLNATGQARRDGQHRGARAAAARDDGRLSRVPRERRQGRPEGAAGGGGDFGRGGRDGLFNAGNPLLASGRTRRRGWPRWPR